MGKIILVDRDYDLDKFARQVQLKYYNATEGKYLILKATDGHSYFILRPPLPLWIIKKHSEKFKLRKTKFLVIVKK